MKLIKIKNLCCCSNGGNFKSTCCSNTELMDMEINIEQKKPIDTEINISCFGVRISKNTKTKED